MKKKTLENHKQNSLHLQLFRAQYYIYYVCTYVNIDFVNCTFKTLL